MKYLLAGAAIFAATFVANTASVESAEIVANGSFERPVVPDGSVNTFSRGEKFAGWKVVGRSGNVFVVGPNYTIGAASFPAKKGKQWLCLTGSSRTRTGVEQKIATVPGEDYLLTFYVGNINNPGAGFGSTSTVKLFIDGTFVGNAKNTAGTATQLKWELFAQPFTAAGSETTIKFLNGDGSTDGINGLDGVAVTLAP
jgi:hypothetical protein